MVGVVEMAGVASGARRRYQAVELKVVRARLARAGSSDPDKLLQATSTHRLSSLIGMDEGAVMELRRHGYLSAADFDSVDKSDLTQIMGIGKKRANGILDWAERERIRCRDLAERNRRRREALERERGRLLTALGREPEEPHSPNDEES